MRAVITVVYVVMGAWLIFGAGARIAIQLSAGQRLDALPFIGGGIGLIALVLLVPAYEDRRVTSAGIRTGDGRVDPDGVGVDDGT